MKTKVIQSVRLMPLMLFVLLAMQCKNQETTTAPEVRHVKKTKWLDVNQGTFATWNTGVEGNRGRDFYVPIKAYVDGLTVKNVVFEGKERQFEIVGRKGLNLDTTQPQKLYFRTVDQTINTPPPPTGNQAVEPKGVEQSSDKNGIYICRADTCIRFDFPVWAKLSDRDPTE